MCFMTLRPHTPNNSLASEQLGVILVNHGGSTVSQDTGRDAQALADSFNLIVIGVDRPGTAGMLPSRRLASALSTPAGYVAETAKLGKRVDHEIEMLGLRRIIAVGRSAGGLGALALARSETVSTLTYLFVAEPAACENISLEEGARRFQEYGVVQKKLQENDSNGRLVKPVPPLLTWYEATRRRASIKPAFLYDRSHNRHILTTDASLQYARYIAKQQQNIDTTLAFAEYSLVVTPNIYRTEALPIALLRREGAPFSVTQHNGTTHASYDNRAYFAQLLQPVVERALSAEG